MDVLVCNGLGIYCGMKTLEWLSLKTYKWQGLWNIPTYKCVSSAVVLSPWGLEGTPVRRWGGRGSGPGFRPLPLLTSSALLT